MKSHVTHIPFTISLLSTPFLIPFHFQTYTQPPNPDVTRGHLYQSSSLIRWSSPTAHLSHIPTSHLTPLLLLHLYSNILLFIFSLIKVLAIGCCGLVGLMLVLHSCFENRFYIHLDLPQLDLVICFAWKTKIVIRFGQSRSIFIYCLFIFIFFNISQSRSILNFVNQN